MSEHIVVVRDGAVQTIRLNRPDKKNALTSAMYAAMTGALRAGEDDDTVRCQVFLGVPGAFCAGNDIADFITAAMGGNWGRETFAFLETLATCRKPIVSGADGIAVGIGTTLHLHCDLTFATPRTIFRTPFVDLGLVPEAGSSLIVPRLLGQQRAFAMLALGEGFSADRAKSAGLIYDVVEEEDLERETLAAAARIAAKPPEALQLARSLMRASSGEVVARIREEASHFAARLKSDEAKAAFAAFMSRKK